MKAPISLLMFLPHPSSRGGVADFIDMLRRHLSSNVVVEPFIIGQRPGLVGKIFRPLVPLYDALRLIWVLLARRHNVHHLNPSLVPLSVARDGLFLIILRAFRRYGILVFFHGWDEKCFQRINSSAFLRFLFREAYKHAGCVYVLASSFPRKLQSLGLSADRIETVSTMFDGELLHQAQRSRKDKGVRILFLARFVVAKGIFQLLNAFKRIAELETDSLLVMAGNGPEYQPARDWCRTHNLEDRVRFPGFVQGIEKSQLFHDADIFILPSSHGEGCPVSMLEAMGAGLPVIVTPVGGIPDIVEDGENGIVLGALNVDEIEDSLLRLIKNPDLRAEMGEKNRRQAWGSYEAKPVVHEIEALYQHLADLSHGSVQ